jgi:putative N6-adenine-specific DNA methylase
LKGVYHVEWFSEDGDAYPVRINLMKDEVSVCLDTTGESLHKRGYRLKTSKAPITETLAAALIMLTPWRGDRILVDPFCGSGTFLIEAAMMAAHIAPGCHREFLSMQWTNLIEPALWKDVMDEALSEIDTDIETDLQGYDIDPEVVKVARENAKRAGVDHLIHFQCREVAKLSHPKKYGFVITNPPYGERISEKADLPKLYGEIGQALKGLDSWSAYLITAYEQAAKHMGMKPSKTRKIYNGMMKTDFLQFIGPKPPRKNG